MPTSRSDSGVNPLSLDEQVCFAITVAARAVVSAYRPVLEPLGLTHPQYLVMLALWEENGLHVRDLAERLALEPATVSPLLKRLERDGLLERRRSARDERTLEVTLTESGQALREEALQVPVTMLRTFGLDSGDLADINRVLRDLIARTRNAEDQT